jgi:predicted ATPase
MATLVGRAAELARLANLLDEAAAGHAVAALVSGDAGVGKSRLVAEVAASAASRGFTVLTGQCAEIGDSVPYLPFADALRTAKPDLEAAVKTRPVLAMLLPDGDGGRDRESDWSGLTKQQMFGAMLGLLAELSDEAPVLLVLEDLHWADATTRDLVTASASLRSAPTAPTTCTAATRSGRCWLTCNDCRRWCRWSSARCPRPRWLSTFPPFGTGAAFSRPPH